MIRIRFADIFHEKVLKQGNFADLFHEKILQQGGGTKPMMPLTFS